MAGETRLERRLDTALARATTPRSAAIVIATASTVTAVVAGILMTVVESEDFPTIGSGLWWAAQTVTTVGYGDNVPVTFAGRILAVLVMLLGISFLTVITAAITSAFVSRSSLEQHSLECRASDRRAVPPDRRAAGTNRGRADPALVAFQSPKLHTSGMRNSGGCGPTIPPSFAAEVTSDEGSRIMAVAEKKESFWKRHVVALLLGGFAALLVVIVLGQLLDSGDIARWLGEVPEGWAYVMCLCFVWFDAVIPVFPGETTLSAASTIAAGGGLQLERVMVAGAIGAILGDSSLFWIARVNTAKMQPHLDKALENEKVRTAWESLDRSPGLLIVAGATCPGCASRSTRRWGSATSATAASSAGRSSAASSGRFTRARSHTGCRRRWPASHSPRWSSPRSSRLLRWRRSTSSIVPGCARRRVPRRAVRTRNRRSRQELPDPRNER